MDFCIVPPGPINLGLGGPFLASNPFFMTLVEKRCDHRSEKYVDFF